MYIDANLLLADTLTTTTAGASTSYIDTTVVSIKAGDAYVAPWWVVKTEAAFVAQYGAPTAAFQLQTSEDASFLDSTTVTLAQSAAFLTAGLTANTMLAKIRIPVGVKRYVRAYMVIGGTGAFSTVSYSSFLSPDANLLLP